LGTPLQTLGKNFRPARQKKSATLGKKLVPQILELKKAFELYNMKLIFWGRRRRAALLIQALSSYVAENSAG
jgi:hypothetical protein